MLLSETEEVRTCEISALLILSRVFLLLSITLPLPAQRPGN